MKTLLFSLLFALSNSLIAQTMVDFDRIIEKDKSIIMKGGFGIKNLKEANYTWFKKNYEGSKFSSEQLAEMRGRFNDLELVVFLGTWCSDSHTLVPSFIKFMESIEYPTEKIQLYGVDRKKETKGIEHRLYHIELVPTIIIMRNNMEVGRITETVEKNIVATLRQLLEKI
jgi:hypothetical protein